jgi:SPASM domain peptide maturase of grasp-with-spasm system
MPDNIFFKLFACCIPVKGHGRAAIYDLQRNSFEYIPLMLNDLLEECKCLSKEDLEDKYTAAEWAGIEKFLEYLVDSEYGFWTNSPDDFPDLSMQWHQPGKLTNAIIEYHEGTSPYSLKKIFDDLEKLRCRVIQIRLFGNYDHKYLKTLIAKLHGSIFCVIDLLVPYSEQLNVEGLLELMKEEHRIIPLTIYNCKNRSIKDLIKEDDKFLMSRVLITSENFSPGKIKEQISIDSFYINMEFFTEAVGFNAGLNRKISIDIDGNIKNHILHKNVFGNVCDQKISEIVESRAFQKIWKIKNDTIEKCNVCEHRYMCMDNSDIVYKNGKAFKKQACSYDPITQKWLQP